MSYNNLVLKHIILYFLYIKLYRLIRSHLPDQPQVYVHIRLRWNYGMSYTHHMRFPTTMQVVSRNHRCFCTCKITVMSYSFLSWWSHRPYPDGILRHQRIIPLMGWHVNTSCHLLQLHGFLRQLLNRSCG